MRLGFQDPCPLSGMIEYCMGPEEGRREKTANERGGLLEKSHGLLIPAGTSTAWVAMARSCLFLG